MTYWKRIPLFAAVVISAAIIATPGMGAQTGKIAVIDTSQIIAQSAAGLTAEADYRAWLTPRQQELVDLQNQITQKGQELEAQQRALSAEALRERQQELERLDRELTRKDEDLAADAGRRQQELLQPVLALADQALTALAAEQNFLMIFDVAALSQVQGAIVYLSPTADLSTEVIRRMDDAYSAAGGVAPDTLPVPGEPSALVPEAEPPQQP